MYPYIIYQKDPENEKAQCKWLHTVQVLGTPYNQQNKKRKMFTNKMKNEEYDEKEITKPTIFRNEKKTQNDSTRTTNKKNCIKLYANCSNGGRI